ncbi:SAC3/GANP/Nin1/mts3/eIF-3 p25 family-domain-containing protein [Hypoxylon crocopeplum]|nr:SAC3/GANP/Nin1/mts3/eIF-3 p25 family-domain-containing protein [Hypoxylon crocopeplum]
MFSTKVNGGWGADQAPNPPSNAFGRQMPSLPPINPFAKAPVNPFSTIQSDGTVPAPSPFSSRSPTPNIFQTLASKGQNRSTSSTFTQASASTPKPNPFGKPGGAQGFGSFSAPASDRSSTPNAFSKRLPTFPHGGAAPAMSGMNGKKKVSEYVKPAWPKQHKATGSGAASTSATKGQINGNGKRKIENGFQRQAKFSRTSPTWGVASFRSRSTTRESKRDDSPKTNKRAKPRVEGNRDDFAKKILAQLARDNIKPPRWPSNPGSHASRQAIERFRETHKAYRDKVRKSLTRVGLIDDPDKKRRLDEALVFKGICEDMCPEWERITRIVEHDIRGPEKDIDEYGDLVAIPELMVKRLARSAAGQDAPLPMDVRSVSALCRTLDYLIDELISSDDLLPQRHSFLWDRTRAIRIDFSFQKYAMTPEEIKDQIYCLETIARFHVTALHLLSQNGVTPQDFSEQQETEQLGKTLMSLIEVYDECEEQGIICDNEAEFRGYYIVYNAHNPGLLEIIEGWERRHKAGIPAAVSIVECIENIRKIRGPLRDASGQLAIDSIAIFFDIVADPSVSYTMACFAEIHFNYVRRAILKSIRKSLSRPRFGPKDITPTVLKQCLRTDTEEEAIDFFEKHGFHFESRDGYVILSPGLEYIDARIPHPYSGDIVERKRLGRTLPTVIHKTVFETDSEGPSVQQEQDEEEEESLFVSDSQDVTLTSINNNKEGHLGRSSDTESNNASSSAPAGPTATPANKGTKTEPSSSWPSNSFMETAGNKAINQGDTSSSNTSSSIPTTKKVTFGDVSGGFTTTHTNNTTTASPFGSLGKSETKDSTTPTTTPPSTNLFSSLIPNTSNTDGSQPPTPWSTPTISGAGFGFATSTTPISSPFSAVPFNTLGSSNKDGSQLPPPSDSSMTPESRVESPASSVPPMSAFEPTEPTVTNPPIPTPLTNAQPSGVTEADQPSSTISQPSIMSPQQIMESPATSTHDALPTAHADNLPKGALSTAKHAAPSKQTGLTTSTNTVQKDPLSDLARWFVCGDKGLMEEQFQRVAVEHALKSVWDGFQASEAKRIRKEEDEKSWAEAREFRNYSLRVKFFYRWHDGFRKRAIVRRMKLEKEKARQWKLPENVAKRERETKEEQDKILQEIKASILKRSRHNGGESTKKSSVRPKPKPKGKRVGEVPTQSSFESSSSGSRAQSIEEALLATGVFKGVRDERAAARHATMDCDETDEKIYLEKTTQLRSENHRRLQHGLSRLKSLPEPKVDKEGLKTALMRARYGGAGGDSMSMSTGSLRNSTRGSSHRSSRGQSKYRVSKPRSRVSDPYWRLKASGLVRMPNGEYLHESIALPMLQEGKRFPGFGDYGLPPVKHTTPYGSPSPPPSGFSSPPILTNEIRPDERSSSPSNPGSQKRKRCAEEDLVPNGDEYHTSKKRARSGDDGVHSAADTDQHLADIASLLARVNGVVKSTSKAKVS